MSKKVREEMLPRLRLRYLGRGPEGRSKMLDELTEQFGYSRKHAIKLLGGHAGWGGDPSVPKGRPPIYGEEVVEILWYIWQHAEQPCGKRLTPVLRYWLPAYEREQGPLTPSLKKRVLSVSPAQVDRLLAPRKARDERRRRCGTKPGGLLKNQIAIRTNHDEITSPGWLEADTVAHCGGSLEGTFIWSVTYTDIYSGWTSMRAIWNKGEAGVVEATRSVESSLPFALEGFDCDNGSEFLNWHLYHYLKDERKQPVHFTRSRPYKKDDNGHVEQKNWTHIRQLLGYGRLEDASLVEEINRIHQEIWEPLNNYFLPSAKLIGKTRVGAKVARRHDEPMTPCDRLLESPDVAKATQRNLRRMRKELNPFELKRQLEASLKRVLEYAHPARRPTGSLPDGHKNATKNTTTPVS